MASFIADTATITISNSEFAASGLCVQDISLEYSREYVDFYCMGTTGKQKLGGYPAWTGSCECSYDDTLGIDLNDLCDGVLHTIVVASGETMGFTGEAYINVSVKLSANDRATATLTFEGSGDLVEAAS